MPSENSITQWEKDEVTAEKQCEVEGEIPSIRQRHGKIAFRAVIINALVDDATCNDEDEMR